VEDDYYLKILCFFLNSTISSTGRELIAITQFEKLVTSLRTAISDDLGKLDNEVTSYNNVLVVSWLSLRRFKLSEKESEHVLSAAVEN
jgi:hypothetical protein